MAAGGEDDLLPISHNMYLNDLILEPCEDNERSVKQRFCTKMMSCRASCLCVWVNSQTMHHVMCCDIFHTALCVCLRGLMSSF